MELYKARLAFVALMKHIPASAMLPYLRMDFGILVIPVSTGTFWRLFCEQQRISVGGDVSLMF